MADKPLDDEVMLDFTSIISENVKDWPEKWWNSDVTEGSTFTIETLQKSFDECMNYQAQPQTQVWRTVFTAPSEQERVKAAVEVMGLEVVVEGSPLMDPGVAIASTIDPEAPLEFAMDTFSVGVVDRFEWKKLFPDKWWKDGWA